MARNWVWLYRVTTGLSFTALPCAGAVFQECERMNMLTGEIRRSLKELDLGLKVGRLTAERGAAAQCQLSVWRRRARPPAAVQS